MYVKTLDRAATKVEYGVPALRTLSWDDVVTPPFGSMWGVLAPGMRTDLDVHDEHETLVVTQGRGDLVHIVPGTTHPLHNTSAEELVALFVWWG